MLAAVVNLGLGLFVYVRNRLSVVNQAFFVMIFAFTSWIVFNLLADGDIARSLVWNRLTYGAGILMALFILYFVLIFARILQRLFLFTILMVPAIILFAVSVFTGGVVQSVEVLPWGTNPSLGSLYAFFPVLLAAYLGGSLVVLFLRYRSAKGRERAAILYTFFGLFLSVLAGFFTNVSSLWLFDDFRLAKYAPISGLFFFAFTAYSIIAHRLFDIRVIIRKTVVYSGLLAFVIGAYSLIIFTLATVFGTEAGISRATFLPNLLAALVIAAGFEPLRRWLVATTDKYLFVGEYDSSQVIEELSKTLSGVIDLDEALMGMMQTVSRNLRLRSAATFVLRRFKNQIEVKRVKFVGYHRPEILTLEDNDPLIAHFEGAAVQPVVTEEFERALEELPPESRKSATISPVVRKLQDLHAAVALPLVVKDQLIGISLFGEKLSGDYFTEQDLDLLTIVAHETAGAIEKARFYEEDQLKSEFVSIASHELLTPVAGIQGYLSLVLDEGMGKVDPKARGYLVKVRETTGRLTELVNDLLNVSRIEGGRIKVNPQAVAGSDVVKIVVEELLPKAKDKGLSLSADVPPSLPKIWADPDRVRQILVNLVGNGIKYNEKGGVTIVGKKANQNFVEVQVKDTGVGIPPEAIPHLFEKFYRVESDKTAGISGTGLGLYITKNLVEIMGGTIGVESEVGKGSTFWVRLPTAKEGT